MATTSTEEPICPSLNNQTSNPVIITIETLKSLRLSSYNRSIGAIVHVSCSASLKLYGSPKVTCQQNLTWSDVPTCDIPPLAEDVSDKMKIIISLSSITGFLFLVTLIAIFYAILRTEKKEREDYRHIQNGRPSNSPKIQKSRYAYDNYMETEFYGPKSHPPSFQRNDNVRMTPVTLPQQNKKKWEVMETAIPRLPSNTSLDAPSNFKKKKYDFEEFNVYALRQGRDPFLWRPVVSICTLKIEPTKQPTHETNEPTNQINHPTNQSDQATNQPTNRKTN